MGLLEEIEAKLDRIGKIDFDMLFVRAMRNPGMQQQFIDFNQHQLNEEGVWADGTPTGPYTAAYEKVKKRKEQTYDHKTLRDTGYLQDSMVIAPMDKAVVINADMVKNGFDLVKHYSEALGLTEESRAAIAPMLMELMMDEFHKEVDNIMNGK